VKSLTHLFKKTALLTGCFVSVFFNKTTLFAQEDTPITRKIDSLRETYLDNTSDSIHHRLLRWSKKITIYIATFLFSYLKSNKIQSNYTRIGS